MELYLIAVWPRFHIPAELVQQFKTRGYRWVKRGPTWILEKPDCDAKATEEERNFVEGLGSQKWMVSFLPCVGTIDQECRECGHRETQPVYDPLLFGMQGIDRCPKCKAFAFQNCNPQPNAQYHEWKKEADAETFSFAELIKEQMKDV